MLRTAHKYYSRVAQRASVPEATPDFDLIDLRALDGGPPAVRMPCFLKPVKGSFSVLTREVRTWEEARAFLADPSVAEYTERFLQEFGRLLREFTTCNVDARHFLAESLLAGEQVTVEGWCRGGAVEILGIVDSVVAPGTRSFVRFDYPSVHDRATQDRMSALVRRVIPALGLENTLFNVELMVDRRTGDLGIIEVNPRMAGQFADLYEKVDGVNGYEVALALAVGEEPPLRRGEGRYRVAASAPLRVFEPVRAVRVPNAEDVARAEALYPGTMVWVECRAGDELADFRRFEDGASSRYGVINLGAPDRASLDERLACIRDCLGFEFAPL